MQSDGEVSLIYLLVCVSEGAFLFNKPQRWGASL